MRVHQSRTPPADRTPVEPVRATAQTTVFPAPTGGKVTNVNLAAQRENTAQVMRNFWPTERGLEPRGGSRPVTTIDGPTVGMFSHSAGDQKWLFASTATKLYEIDPVQNDKTLVLDGQTSGDYSTSFVVTDDLTFLMIVNGTDPAQVFDGDTWSAVNETSTPYAITGVDTAGVSHIWNYRNRQFFIKRGSMDAYYLPVNNAFGAAERLPLGGVFNKGGSLLSGATWSSDSGEGVDDRCVFITDQGEFAVFQGADPSLINSWSLVGVFDMGTPLSKNTHFSVGGDLLFCTRSGLIPLSAAVQKTTDQLGIDALSHSIEPDWLREVLVAGNTPGWMLANWHTKHMLLIGSPKTPGVDQNLLVVNTQTRAWTDFTGWDVAALCIFDDGLFFGGNDGAIYEGDVGGRDNGIPFVCQLSYAFSHLGAPGAVKQCSLARAWFRHRHSFTARVSVATDYRTSLPTPTPVPEDASSGNQWDAVEWDVTNWDGGTDQVTATWSVLFAHGVAIAPQIQILSAVAEKLNVEFINLEIVHETGGGVV